MSDFFGSLDDDSLEEFPWLSGLDGGHFITELASGGDIFAAMDEEHAENERWWELVRAYWKEQERLHPTPPLPQWDPRKHKKRSSPKRKEPHIDVRIVVRPEGSGKSSMIRQLVKGGFKVVFCSKSNTQLEQQELGFRQRWPDLRISRYVSKGHNLTSVLEAMGISNFKISSAEPASPYAAQRIDKEATLERLREALVFVGLDPYSARGILQREYEDYKAPTLDGLNLDVMMMTTSAFQALATSYRHAWWEALMLTVGTIERDIPDGSLGPFKTHAQAKQANYRYTTPVGFKALVVVIDDPDYTDFDWLRLIDDDDKANDLYHRTKPRRTSTTEYWIAKGFGQLTAERLAQAGTKNNPRGTVAHNLSTFNGHHFERRPMRNTIGFGLTKGYRRNKGPTMLVLTTERITAAYAQQTFTNMRLVSQTSVELPSTDQCHVTTLMTKIVRKANHALLIPIIERLRQEFPNEDLCFIANGLGAEHNLSSTRGRNDLAERSSLIKLSIPHPSITTTLQAHFARTQRTRLLHSWYLADACNQALGRNQGARWHGRSAIVLIDPIYYNTVVGLLRYRRTPWSTGADAIPSLRYHDDETPLELRLGGLLAKAEAFGLSNEALELVAHLPMDRSAPFLEWRNKNLLLDS